jgi:hypothetical protein
LVLAGKELHYAARVRAGFVPLARRHVFERIKPLESMNGRSRLKTDRR